MEAGGVVDATVNMYNPWAGPDITTSHYYSWYNHGGRTGEPAIETTDKDTGVTTRNSYVWQLSSCSCGVGCGASGGDQGDTPEVRPWTDGTQPAFVITKDTNTEIEFIANVGCKVYHGQHNEAWSEIVATDGVCYERLTDPDTEADAEARALAAASEQDWTGPTSDSCQVASFRTDRGNTFSWSATQTQHRAQVPDYNPDNPDAEYEVDLWYVVTEGLMSARWVTEGFHTVTKKPTKPGDNWTEWVDIPIPEVGFFAWHMGCRVRVHNSGS
jgi:hypothetical protein